MAESACFFDSQQSFFERSSRGGLRPRRTGRLSNSQVFCERHPDSDAHHPVAKQFFERQEIFFWLAGLSWGEPVGQYQSGRNGLVFMENTGDGNFGALVMEPPGFAERKMGSRLGGS